MADFEFKFAAQCTDSRLGRLHAPKVPLSAPIPEALMSLSRRSRLTAKATQRLVDCKIAWVVAAAFCLLLLSTPGVSVVRASDDIASAQRGQTCESSGSEKFHTVMEFRLDRLRRDKTSQPAPSGELIHGLNNSGFNYRPAPVLVAPQSSRGAR